MTAVAALTRRLAGRRAVLGGAALAALVELVPGTPTLLLALAGLWLLLGAPVVLWYDVASRVVSTRDGQALLAVGLAIIGDIAVALTVNTVLPHLGMAHPLTRAPLAVASTLALLITVAVCPAHEPAIEPAWWRAVRTRAVPRGLVAVSVSGIIVLVLSIAGPIRLNNGLGSQVSVAALVGIAALLTLLMVRCRRYPSSVLELGLFSAAAGLLLLTSLRGWYITGHDIQREYEVFQLTAGSGHWDIAAFRDPYNACLSITLLPTALAKLTGISGLYVFKVVLPLLFALTPVLVYRSVLNVAPRLVAVLSAVYFMAFPTFFTDMTFLGRQEIAFILLGCATVVLTDRGGVLRNRRLAFTVLTVGIVLSHYSTAYTVLVVLGVGLGTDLGWRVLTRMRRRTRPGAVQRSFVTWWMVAVAAAGAFVWAGPATHTVDEARHTLATTVQNLAGHGQSTRSSDTQYSLFGGDVVSPAQRLSDYRAETVAETAAGRTTGAYMPLSVVDPYAVPVAQKQVAPLTPVGRVLQQHGVDMKAADGFVRQSIARLLQVLLFIGVATTMLGRRKVFRPTRDQVTLTAGMLVVVGLFTVLPQVSVEYGVLRAFQQGLFLFAPFIAAGSLWIFRWARRLGVPIACALALVLFLDLSGVVPKAVGGSPPQLHLSNAGQYYDLYYVQPEEHTAITWLEARTSESERTNVQSEVQTDRFTFSRLQTLIRGRALNDIYPTLVGTDSYVFLGSTTVRQGDAAIFYHGDIVTYRYPTAFLDTTKDELYSSNGAEIYR